MQIGKTYHGFLLERIEPVADLESMAYLFLHEKSGAKLMYLENKDVEKAFSIAFKTIPEDSTGVFHILEHSVLCGSDKYPVKEPFVNLLKTSMQTFLNAMTFPDKTMYPLSSTNEKDFVNLMGVYMDAVLCPRIYTKKEIFLQEGWHLEKDADGNPFFNGVVYNEMKGAYSSVDRQLFKTLGEAMYPDTTYGFSSGGDPSFIPSLTYEQFLAFHKKYYHPENSFIFLYGEMDLCEKLAFLDKEYLSKYTVQGNQFEIEMQKPLGFKRVDATCMIDEAESEENNATIGLSYLCGTFADREDNMALSLILDTIADSNDAPLKKMVLESGLGQEFEMGVNDGTLQAELCAVLRKTNACDADRFLAFFKDAIAQICEQGIDREALIATLNSTEFYLRENDNGMPRGLNYAISVMDGWLYGADPVEYLSNLNVLASIREKFATDYPEKLLARVILESEHSVMAVLHPSKTKAAELAKEAADKAKAYAASLTEAQKAQAEAEAESLARFQQEEDTPELLATLPQLSLSDLSPTPVPADKTEKTVKNGVTYLHHDINAGGIVYVNYHFDVSSLPLADFPKLTFLSSLLGDLPTERMSAFELQTALKSKLGQFHATTHIYPNLQTNENSVHFVVSASALTSQLTVLQGLTKEIITTAKFPVSDVQTILSQEAIALQQALVSRGNKFASIRASAAVSEEGRLSDLTEGYGYIQYVNEANSTFGDGGKFCKELADLLGCVLACPLTVSVCSDKETYAKFLESTDNFANNCLQNCEKTHVPLLKTTKQAIRISGSVAYDAKCADLSETALYRNGRAKLLSRILSLDYLWNRVRVRGGAYGCSVSISDNGIASFSSYRDPNVQKTFDVFHATAEYLRAFTAGETEMAGYIIGVIASFDRPALPKARCRMADMRYFGDVTEEIRQKTRTDVLTATAEDIRSFASAFDGLAEKGAICAVACAEKVEQNKEMFDEILA